MAVQSTDIETLIEALLRLRRAEAAVADTEAADDIWFAREAVEALVGPTVRPAQAARLLGVRPPSLHRWLERGDVATVITPQGRREIPRSELLDLLDEVEAAKETGVARPVTHVMHERQRRAEASIDVKRLLPSRSSRLHRVPELQALAYHRLLAERLDERTIREARRRLRQWLEDGRMDERWAQEWSRILALPLEQIAAQISADTKRARELRQTSPFAGMLNEHERRLLARAVEQRIA